MTDEIDDDEYRTTEKKKKQFMALPNVANVIYYKNA